MSATSPVRRPRGPRLLVTLLTGILACAVVLVSCSGSGGGDGGDGSAQDGQSTEATPSTTATPAPRPPRPEVGGCYALTYEQAVKPTTKKKTKPCDKDHTATTYAVELLDVVVDGHLLAVDSDRAREQVSSTCLDRFAGWVGGSEEDRRLSMLAPVWFSPSLERSDEGELWFRCDVVAVGAERTLTSYTGKLKGILGSADGRQQFGLCSTGSPDSDNFTRVICSSDHSWRAVSTVDLAAETFPGAAAASTVKGPCQDAARDVAGDALDYDWGYELPTKKQWKQGQRYAVCWAPD